MSYACIMLLIKDVKYKIVFSFHEHLFCYITVIVQNNLLMQHQQTYGFCFAWIEKGDKSNIMYPNMSCRDIRRINTQKCVLRKLFNTHNNTEQRAGNAHNFISHISLCLQSRCIINLLLFQIVKRQHVQIFRKHWSSANRMSTNQNGNENYLKYKV